MGISVLISCVYTLPFFKCLLVSHFPASDILLSHIYICDISHIM